MKKNFLSGNVDEELVQEQKIKRMEDQAGAEDQQVTEVTLPKPPPPKPELKPPPMSSPKSPMKSPLKKLKLPTKPPPKPPVMKEQEKIQGNCEVFTKSSKYLPFLYTITPFD